MKSPARLPRAPGPVIMAGLVVVPVVLWAVALPLGPRFADLSTALTSVGVAFGLMGVSSFALNLVLGARLRGVQRAFGGLEEMYRAHRVNGRIAFVLLAVHMLAIVAGRALSSFDGLIALFDPSSGWTVLLGVIAFLGLTVGMILTLFVRLNHEVFVYVQRAFGIVFIIALFHVFMTPGTKATSPALTYYLAALSVAGLAAFGYRSLFGNLLVRRREYEVVAVNRLDEHVTEIVMKPRGKPLLFTPGQFVFVNFLSPSLDKQLQPVSVHAEGQSAVVTIRPGDIANQFHPFSITSAPAERDLRISVKAVGDYTRALRWLEPGAVAIVEGPYGSFSHRNVPGAKQVWLSGGIGLTPFLSMARSLRGESLQIDLYYCVERDPEAYFLEEFQRVAEREPNFRVIPLIRERDGFVTAERIESTSEGLGDAHFLICGPPAMIEALRGQLLAKGVAKARIHAEEFGFARLGGGRRSGAG